MRLHIDLETFCELSIFDVGVHKYVDHHSFEILLLCYKINDKPTKCIDLARGEVIPQWLIDYILDELVTKKAWNAFFEFKCLSKYIEGMTFINWRCTMVKSAYNGYPLGLGDAGKALKLENGKLEGGKDGITYFCKPCKPTKRNGGRTRNYPIHDILKWKDFIKYGKRDVDVEYEIDSMLEPLPDREQMLYELDQAINFTGIKVDLNLIKAAISHYNAHERNLIARMQEITGIDNPNSPAQIKRWIYETYCEFQMNSLKSKDIVAALKGELPKEVREVLQIRVELSLSSIKKYQAMLNMADENGVIRGLYQFYGAIRTGRWAGRGVQVHNLARQKSKLETLRLMREAIRDSFFNCAQIDMMYGSVSKLLKEVLRTAFIPKGTFYIADYSSIEAIMLAFLAGEKWKLDVFKGHGKIYEAAASKMFGVPVEDIAEDSEERQKGKISELALGYGGGAGALITMGALEMGIKEQELEGLKDAWRAANPNIVRFWRLCENAFKAAFANPGRKVHFCSKLFYVKKNGKGLELYLPSGRSLYYPGAFMAPGKYGDAIHYYGPNQTSKKWQKQHLYGGKIVENIVQALSRDILAEGMLRLSSTFDIPLHVHDELAFDIPLYDTGEEDYKAKDRILEELTRSPDWLPGLPLRVKAFESPFYRKN